MEGQAGRKQHEDVNTTTRVFLFVLFSLCPADFSGFEGNSGKCAIVAFS